MFLYRDKFLELFRVKLTNLTNLGPSPSSVAWLVTRMISPAFIGCWLLYSDSRCWISDKGPGDGWCCPCPPGRSVWVDRLVSTRLSINFISHIFGNIGKNHINKTILIALIWFSNKNPFIDPKSYPVDAWTSLGWPSVTAGECRPLPVAACCCVSCQCHNTNIGTQSEQIGEMVN